jgi:hypothetical protein
MKGVKLAASVVVVGGAEDAGGCEYPHEATQAGDLGRVERGRGPGNYLGQGGSTTVAVDGVGDAEVQCRLECHGLYVSKGRVPEL